jgi:hypothetical protein
MKLKTFDMAKIEEKALFIVFLLEQGLLAPVDQDELILCDLGISHRLSSVEAMLVSAWHNAARKSRHRRWRENDIQETEFGL